MLNEWVECWEGFYVNRDGDVLRKSDKKLLPQSLSPSGYAFVNIYDGTTHPQRVHRLVAKAFIENPLSKEHVNHVDGDKLNNNVTNLEWVTHSENMQHAAANKLTAIGEKNAVAVFTTEDVVEIKAALSNGMGCAEIARMLDTSPGAIQSIKDDKTWKHVPWPVVVAMKRGHQGENNSSVKLKAADVAEIRKLLVHGELTCKEIGVIYGVGRKTVSDIKTGKTWVT